MSNFDQKVVVVTGAGRGVGRAVAQAFASRGAAVAANDITPVNLDETLAQIARVGGRGKDYVFDISKKMPAQAFLEQVLEDFSRIDVLINRAHVHPRAPFLDMDEWDWRRTLDVNLTGPFLLMQSAARIMRQQGRGVILNIISFPSGGQAQLGRFAYLSSVHGLLALTQLAARELAPYGIRANAICLEATALPPAGQAGTIDAAAQAQGVSLHQKAVEMALFLAGEAAAHINGQQFTLRDSG